MLFSNYTACQHINDVCNIFIQVTHGGHGGSVVIHMPQTASVQTLDLMLDLDLEQLYVLVSSAHKTTHYDMT